MKPQHEIIPISVPAILDRRTFDKVQKALRAKSPHNSPPRVISGPILLTGLAYCACCGSAMTLRAGTSKSRRVYRYYSCSTSGRVGKSACMGRIENQGAAASRLDPDKLVRFAQLMRSNITEGEVPFRKAYLRSLIDAVEVDQHVVRIHGSRTVLERAVLADRATQPGVRGFVRKWRAHGESNPGFRRERATS